VKVEIQINSDNVYITTDTPKAMGGFKLSMFRGKTEDLVLFDGDEAQKEFALKLADVCLEGK